MRPYLQLSFLGAVLLLGGCNTINNDLERGLAYGTDSDRLTRKADEAPAPGERKSKINAYMWRASLNAVQAFPLEMSKPQQGLIVTEWYSSPGYPDDRKQITIEILGADVRRDLLRVSVMRQLKENGEWTSAPPPAGIAQQMEDTIIFNAKQLRHW